MKKLVIVSLLIGFSLAVLSAFLPVFPYTLTSTDDLLPLKVGFPVPFIRQMPDGDRLSDLAKRGYNKVFTLPRHDLYETTWNIPLLLLDGLILSAALFGVLFLVRTFGKKLKPYLLFLLIGFLIAAVFLFMPAAPGTFKTVEDLDPMTFGFPLRYVEQTPSLASIVTDPELEAYLAQSFIAPRWDVYTTRLDYGLFALSGLLNALILYLPFGLLPALIRRKKRKTE